MSGSSPLAQLVLSRLCEFYREPEVIFWVYGFPLLLAMGLGIAFRERPAEQLTVDVQSALLPRSFSRVSTLTDR